MPQGSILGHLLFICYIKDLPLQCQSTIPSLYADDTGILVVGQNPDEVKVKLQNNLDRLYIWFVKNKLSINCLKTNSIIFTSNCSKFKADKIELTLVSDDIVQTDCVEYLGLYLDLHLNFDSHVKTCVVRLM